MSRAPGRRGRLSLATVAILGLVGCGSGFGAQTIEPYDPGVGANARAGTIAILGALVVAEDGTGIVSATLVAEPGSEEQELTEVSAETLDGDAIDVQVNGSFAVTSQTGEPQQLGESAIVVLTGDTFAPGDFIDVTFTFSDAEPFEVQMPVVARTGDGTYDDVAEAPA